MAKRFKLVKVKGMLFIYSTETTRLFYPVKRQ